MVRSDHICNNNNSANGPLDSASGRYCDLRCECRRRIEDGELRFVHFRCDVAEEWGAQIPLSCVRKHCKNRSTLRRTLGNFERCKECRTCGCADENPFFLRKLATHTHCIRTSYSYYTLDKSRVECIAG